MKYDFYRVPSRSGSKQIRSILDLEAKKYVFFYINFRGCYIIITTSLSLQHFTDTLLHPFLVKMRMVMNSLNIIGHVNYL